MSSNVINFFEVKRSRDANATAATTGPRQLDLFDGEFTSGVVTHARTSSPDVVQTAPSRRLVADDKFLFVVIVESFQLQDDFLNFCKAMHPDLIVDLRVAPRLDFVRPMRKQAFEFFDACGIEYRDLLGRLGATTYDLPQPRFEEIVAAVDSLHSSQDSERPTIVLFDDATFAQSCTTKLSQGAHVTALDCKSIHRMVNEGARERM